MRKRILAFLAILVMIVGVLPMNTAFAASPTVIFQVETDKTTIHPGDEVEVSFCVNATTKISTWTIKIEVPEGFSYVPNSGAVDANLKSNTGADGDASFTENNKMFFIGTSALDGLSGLINLRVGSYKLKANDDIAVKEYEIGLRIEELCDENVENYPIDLYSVAKAKVNVELPVTGIALDKTTHTMSNKAGENTVILTPIFTPVNTSQTKVTWKSSDETIARVQDGVVTALKKGDVTITATAQNGSEATCAITVNCAHNHTTQTPAKPSTCLVNGNGAYTKCDDCGQITEGTDALLPLGDCVGGTATCKEKAKCTVCQKYYGDFAAHNLTHHSDVPATHEGPGNIEYWTCDVCGKFFNDASGKSEITEKDTVIEKLPHSHGATWKKDSTNHWNECACGDKININKHVYDNNCDTTCNVCSYVRTITHDWDSKWFSNGEWHWHECKVCHVKKDQEGHKGGTATCEQKAACSECGTGYGEYGAHKLSHHAAVPATHNGPGNIEYWTCDVCEKFFSDVAGKSEITEKDTVLDKIPHSHGTIWEKDDTNHWNECECGDKIHVNNHSYDNNCDTTCNVCSCVRTIIHDWDSKWISDGDQHWNECKVCHEKKDQAGHKGGTATCEQKATCSECGTQYGKYGAHELSHHVADPATHEGPGNIEYWTCDVCEKFFGDASGKNEIAEKDTVLDKIPHSHRTTWEKDDTNHWNECECGDKINMNQHMYDNNCDTICNMCFYTRTITHNWSNEWSTDGKTHWHECRECQMKKDEVEHEGGSATCSQLAVCDVCGTSYGEYVLHTLSHSEASPATSDKLGNIEYWTCDQCGKFFKDVEGKHEIAKKDTVLSKLPTQEDAEMDKNNQSPQTGDVNQAVIWGIIGFLAVVLAEVLVFEKRKQMK